MTVEINELLNQKELAAKELQKAEFRALQAQINPHFLYNTLDMINWLAKSGQISQVSQAVQALTRFYRLTLGQKELFGTIDDEITHVTLYMQLQNMRYNHCADFIADIPQSLAADDPQTDLPANCRNALLHGILMKEEKGLYSSYRLARGEDAVLVISDDGAIAPEKLIRLDILSR
ncbi:MAG: sensor histidine kinase [Clostridium sp.]